MENKGFTLIELLIVIAIIGILVGVALPSYQAHTRKANRIDVQLEMTKMSLIAERQFARQNTYPSAATDTIASYTLSSATSTISYKMTATPLAGQLSDDCGEMTLDQTGTVTVKGGSSSQADLKECW